MLLYLELFYVVIVFCVATLRNKLLIKANELVFEQTPNTCSKFDKL